MVDDEVRFPGSGEKEGAVECEGVGGQCQGYSKTGGGGDGVDPDDSSAGAKPKPSCNFTGTLFRSNE